MAILAIIALLRGHFQEGLTYCTALKTLAAGNYNVEHQSWAICGHALNSFWARRGRLWLK